MTAVFTPHTSVTSAPGLKRSLCSFRNPVIPAGSWQSTTTSAPGSSGPGPGAIRSPAPFSAACSRTAGDRSVPTISKSSKPRRAMASEPPMRPRPTTKIFFISNTPH